MQAVALGVFHECGGVVESERIVVKHRRHKTRPVMDHKIRRRVGEQGETECMRFGKAVIGKSEHTIDDIFLHFFWNASFLHTFAQIFAYLFELFSRFLKAHRLAEVFGLVGCKSGNVHRYFQELFLKQRNTHRPL